MKHNFLTILMFGNRFNIKLNDGKFQYFYIKKRQSQKLFNREPTIFHISLHLPEGTAPLIQRNFCSVTLTMFAALMIYATSVTPKNYSSFLCQTHAPLPLPFLASELILVWHTGLVHAWTETYQWFLSKHTSWLKVIIFNILGGGFLCSDLEMSHMGQVMRKCVLWHMRTTKAQISIRIRAVCSAPLLLAA